MSDRRGRDRGNKISRQKHRHLCDCWLCTDGKTKKRVLTERLLRNSKSDPSRVGLGDNDNDGEPLGVPSA